MGRVSESNNVWLGLVRYGMVWYGMVWYRATMSEE